MLCKNSLRGRWTILHGRWEMGSDQNLHPRSINEANSRIYCRMGGTWTSLFRRSWLSNLALSTAIQLCRGTAWNLKSFVIAEDVPVLANDCLPSEKFFAASKVVIGVTSPIWVPIGVVAFVLSVPVVGVVAMKEKLGNWNTTRKYEND